MRRVIAAMHVTLDGFIEGPNGELDWIETWEDSCELMSQVDTCVLGGGMYPGYEAYWCSILRDPGAVLPFTGKLATPGEVDYAKWADRTPHIVLSTSLRQVGWRVGRITGDAQEIAELKGRPGKDIYAVGGSTLVSGLLELGLIDELRLDMHPVVLGRGKALFKDITHRHPMRLLRSRTVAGGVVNLAYAVESGVGNRREDA